MKSFILSCIVGIIVFLFFPFDVHGLTISSSIQNWDLNTDLSFTFGTITGDSSNGITYQHNVILQSASQPDITISSVDTTTFSLSDYSFSVGDDIILTETFDAIVDSNATPGYHSFSVIPGEFSYGTTPSSVQSYMTTNYQPVNSLNGSLLVLNEVNQNSVPTGNRVLDGMYFIDSTDNKIEEISQGIINIPSYCVKYTTHIKGNIANEYGTFSMSFPNSNDDFSFSVSSLTSSHTVSDKSLSFLDTVFSQSGEVSYLDSSANDDYTITIQEENNSSSLDDALVLEGDEFCLYMNVDALLNADGSNTGLFYRIFPFALLSGILLFVLFFTLYQNKNGLNNNR